MRTVAALFVATDGCYFGLPDVDPWDVRRDARLYAGPHPVVALLRVRGGVACDLMRKALETIRENGVSGAEPMAADHARLVLSELGVSYSGS